MTRMYHTYCHCVSTKDTTAKSKIWYHSLYESPTGCYRSQTSYQSSEGGMPTMMSTLSVVVPTRYTPNYHGPLRLRAPNSPHTTDISVGAATYGFSVTSHIDTVVLSTPEDPSSMLGARILHGTNIQQGYYQGQEFRKTRHN